ncbi:hypothetical protein BDY21DRAFT_332534 [Lineolata rhizophorae]|uniref:Uncharacterized protein n=1 Tax=Lineolata rhizophorae TaxID=578093 RepID=A0A6A6PC50_9PEZI|nr:hypothetical protein BDY21DRAFT_332534 [Lineolata rhizophorae]
MASEKPARRPASVNLSLLVCPRLPLRSLQPTETPGALSLSRSRSRARLSSPAIPIQARDCCSWSGSGALSEALQFGVDEIRSGREPVGARFRCWLRLPGAGVVVTGKERRLGTRVIRTAGRGRGGTEGESARGQTRGLTTATAPGASPAKQPRTELTARVKQTTPRAPATDTGSSHQASKQAKRDGAEVNEERKPSEAGAKDAEERAAAFVDARSGIRNGLTLF